MFSRNDWMLGQFILPFLAILLIFGPNAVQAEDPSAIVDTIDGEMSGLEEMDLLWPGQKITLPDNVTLTIGYLDACRSEVITGGTITIGQQESQVIGGDLEADKLDCAIEVQGSGSKKEAVALTAVFRNSKKKKATKQQKSERLLRSQQPAFLVSGETDRVMISRLDDTEEKIPVIILKQGRADLAKTKIRLTSGVVYKMEANGKSMLVRIAEEPMDNAPLLMRLIRF